MTDDRAAEAPLRDRLRSDIDGLGARIEPSGAVTWARRLALREIAPPVATELQDAVLDALDELDSADAAAQRPTAAIASPGETASTVAPAAAPAASGADIGGRVGIVLGCAAPISLLLAVFGALDVQTAMWLATALLAASVVLLAATGGRGTRVTPAVSGAVSERSLRALGSLSIVTVLATIALTFTDLDAVRIVILCAAIQSGAVVTLFALATMTRRKRNAPRPVSPRGAASVAVSAAAGSAALDEERELARIAAVRAPLEARVLRALPDETQRALRQAELEAISLFHERGDIDADRAATASADIEGFWGAAATA